MHSALYKDSVMMLLTSIGMMHVLSTNNESNPEGGVFHPLTNAVVYYDQLLGMSYFCQFFYGKGLIYAPYGIAL